MTLVKARIMAFVIVGLMVILGVIVVWRLAQPTTVSGRSFCRKDAAESRIVKADKQRSKSTTSSSRAVPPLIIFVTLRK